MNTKKQARMVWSQSGRIMTELMWPHAATYRFINTHKLFILRRIDGQSNCHLSPLWGLKGGVSTGDITMIQHRQEDGLSHQPVQIQSPAKPPSTTCLNLRASSSAALHHYFLFMFVLFHPSQRLQTINSIFNIICVDAETILCVWISVLNYISTLSSLTGFTVASRPATDRSYCFCCRRVQAGG